jgi:hypothetical protein
VPIKVFLSGAIEGAEEYGRAWRHVAREILEVHDYKVLDPMGSICAPGASPGEIVDKNLFLQRKADLLLVEYDLANRSYIGTDYELSYAKMNLQPAIVFCNNDNRDRVYLKYLATKIASTLEDAIEYICSNYPTH